MKKLILTLLLAIPFLGIAQEKEISAESILQQIEEGKPVIIENAIITETLDFTELSNKRMINKNSDYREFKSEVSVPLTFVNCTFKGDLIAYKNLDKNGKSTKLGNVSINWNGDSETHTADFMEAVRFENCRFEGGTEFKYSLFAEAVNFEGTTFMQEANFKYATFKELAGFGNCSYASYANFKYTTFEQETDFYQNRFKSYADFKYAKFADRVTFKKTTFDAYSDFKYTKFEKEGNFIDVAFHGTADFKYTEGKRYMNE